MKSEERTPMGFKIEMVYQVPTFQRNLFEKVTVFLEVLGKT